MTAHDIVTQRFDSILSALRNDPRFPFSTSGRFSIAQQDAYIQDLQNLVHVLLRQRNASRPACHLPPEVLGRIFEFAKTTCGSPEVQAVEGSRSVRKHGRETDSLRWINVTYVCALWRAVALGDPSLWADPVEYSAIPSMLLPQFVQRSQNLPFRLDLRGSTIRDRPLGDGLLLSRDFLPSSLLARVQYLRIFRFQVKQFRYIEVHLRALFPMLRKLDISVVVGPNAYPLILPDELCSNTSIVYLTLRNCVPPRWTSPLFSAQLRCLVLRCPQSTSFMFLPSPSELSDILLVSNCLESLDLENVFPPAGPSLEYPSMVVPATLKTLRVWTMDKTAFHRACLCFLAHLVFARRGDLHLVARIYAARSRASDDGLLDAVRPESIPSLTRRALRNIHAQQPAPKHLVIGEKCFLAHDSDHPSLKVPLWPISVEPSLFRVTPLTFLFSCHLELSMPEPLFDDGRVLIPLDKLHSVSFMRPILGPMSDAIFDREIWWNTLKDARGVSRLGIYVDDCDSLLPLAECTLSNDAATFILLPQLQSIHIHVDDILTVDDSLLENKRSACEDGIAALLVLLHNRMVNGFPILELVVDVALKEWEVWDWVKATTSTEVHFRKFYSIARACSRRSRRVD